MRKLSFLLVTVAFLLIQIFFTQAQAQRSFVGKRLSGLTFVDTEGHTINPDHYKDSVLVMFAGIPW